MPRGVAELRWGEAARGLRRCREADARFGGRASTSCSSSQYREPFMKENSIRPRPLEALRKGELGVARSFLSHTEEAQNGDNKDFSIKSYVSFEENLNNYIMIFWP